MADAAAAAAADHPGHGAISVAQLEELLGAVDLRLDGVVERLDAVGARSTSAGPTR